MSVCMQTFVTKLGIVVHHHEPEWHVKKEEEKRDYLFKVKLRVWAYIIKI